MGFKKYDVVIEEERINPTWNFLRISEGESEMRGIIQRCLNSLPDEQREALEMAYFDGLTHYEIAEKLAKPVGTIKTRITLGVAKLRKRLAPYVQEGVE
ncbi:MAG: sigma-70 family RNA polymerase sigma factor [Deltaproteobacteria bacterium]